MKYKCLIVENNLVERDWLEELLGEVEQAEIVAVCKDGLEAMKYLVKEEVDIVFSDIDMPKLSGTELLKSLRNPPAFIFTSAHSHYAAESFDLDVVDFIVKPVTPQRLFKAFSKAKEYLTLRAEAAVTQAASSASENIYFARTDDGLRKIAVHSIVYAESKANYSLLFLLDGSRHLIHSGLKKLEEQLESENFVRIHKNYIINWDCITLIQAGSITISGNVSLPVGDAYKKIIADKIAAHKRLER